MKTKKYIKPEIAIIEIESQQILAGSVKGTAVSDSEADAGIETLSSSFDYEYKEEDGESYSIW